MFLLPFETRHLHAPAGLHLTWQDLLVATDFEKTFSSDGLEPVMYISEVGAQCFARGGNCCTGKILGEKRSMSEN